MGSDSIISLSNDYLSRLSGRYEDTICYLTFEIKNSRMEVPVFIGMDQTEDNIPQYPGKSMGYMDTPDPESIIMAFCSAIQPMVPMVTTQVLDFGTQFSPTNQLFQGCTKCASVMALTLMPSSLPVPQPPAYIIEQAAMVEVGEGKIVSPWARTTG